MNFKLEHTHVQPRFFNTTTPPSEAELDSKITYQFQGTDLKNVLENIQCFLRGTGFIFDGELGIVNENEE